MDHHGFVAHEREYGLEDAVRAEIEDLTGPDVTPSPETGCERLELPRLPRQLSGVREDAQPADRLFAELVQLSHRIAFSLGIDVPGPLMRPNP